MSFTCRIFFVEDNDRVRAIPYARFRRFFFLEDKNERFPEYAKQRLRYVFVIVDLKDRKPVAIMRSDFSVLQFDSAGRLDKSEWLRGAHLAMNSSLHSYAKPISGSIIEANHRFSKKRYDHEFKWTPTEEVLTAIKERIFGRKSEPLKLV